jgi:hypothetical protein
MIPNVGRFRKGPSARAKAKTLAGLASHDSAGTPSVLCALEELLLAAVAYHEAKQGEGEPLTRLAAAAHDFTRAIEWKP